MKKLIQKIAELEPHKCFYWCWASIGILFLFAIAQYPQGRNFLGAFSIVIGVFCIPIVVKAICKSILKG